MRLCTKWTEWRRQRTLKNAREEWKLSHKCCFCGISSGNVERIKSDTIEYLDGLPWRWIYIYHLTCLKIILDQSVSSSVHHLDELELALKITKAYTYWRKKIERGRTVLEQLERRKNENRI